MEKLFVYIDETGKHGQSEQFIVCVVLVEAAKLEQVQAQLMLIESSSGKNRRKWAKSHYARQRAYISQVIETPILCRVGYSLTFPEFDSELDHKCTTIASALNQWGAEDRKIHVLIDGELSRTVERQYKNRLKQYGVRASKVKGVRKGTDDPVSRLADALCGLVRAAIIKEEMVQLYKKAIQSTILTPL